MGEVSAIGWTDATWNPVLGCTKVSAGCDNCYAAAIAERFRGSPGYPNGFDLTLKPSKLNDPLRWKQPRRIFVNSMSDLFHRDIPADYLRQIWDVMLKADQHIYQVLTKRPHRAAKVIADLGLELPPHIWIGTSVENQVFADNRIPALLSIPAQVRFLSCEPLLSAIDLDLWPFGRWGAISWLICGGESGPQRRPFELDWARNLRDQCVAVGVPYYFKQGSALRPGQDRELDGRTWDEMPQIEVKHGEFGQTRPR